MKENLHNNESIDNPAIRRIKSFVLRTGRMTPGQQAAYEAFYKKYGLTLSDAQLNFSALFGNDNPVVLEIGFGMGDSLFQMAKANPEVNYIGVEVHTPGVGRLLNLVSDAELSNVRVFEEDAIKVLDQMIPDNGLSGVQIYFPDPWHKRKHHKRRIVQPEFIQHLVTKLGPEGFIHLATDWEHYAYHMLEVVNANPNLRNASEDNSFIPRPDARPLTKFEKRGERKGHGVWDLWFIKK
ncbi:MAG: tRNA (guanosine(46)-N7)-methyltransferase TrmB [Cellvibrionales bacterium]|nr:tRNA (guanosine(46)-N7)-methyltransferase TrmB [Cellvibrionales bacterium]